MKQYKNLIVWQKAMDLTVQVYGLTSRYPKDEVYGLVSQTNRSAVSVVSNIAEGSGRNLPADFNNFLRFAFGSLCELETQLLLAVRLEYLEEESTVPVFKLMEEIQKMISSLQRTLKNVQEPETIYSSSNTNN